MWTQWARRCKNCQPPEQGTLFGEDFLQRELRDRYNGDKNENEDLEIFRISFRFDHAGGDLVKKAIAVKKTSNDQHCDVDQSLYSYVSLNVEIDVRRTYHEDKDAL